MQRGLVTICKEHTGCVGVLVTMLWQTMCMKKRLTYKNLLLKAQLSLARTTANFHFIWDAFTFKTSCFESRFLLLNMGLSSRTTAHFVCSFGLGYPGFLRESLEGDVGHVVPLESSSLRR